MTFPQNLPERFLLLILFSLSLTSQGITAEEHHRSKRLSLSDALNYGCIAVTAVRHCTDLLENCADICNKIDTVCEHTSSNSELLKKLCEEGEKVKLKKFFKEELPKLAKGGAETEKALKEFGGHFESIGQKILHGIESGVNTVKNAFRPLIGEGHCTMSSVIVMATCLLVALPIIYIG